MPTTIPASRQLRITKPVCPTCGATLRVRIMAIAPVKDGFIADQIDVQCEGAMPTDTIEAERWVDRHAVGGSKMRPIREQLLRWVNTLYRFTPTERPMARAANG